MSATLSVDAVEVVASPRVPGQIALGGQHIVCGLEQMKLPSADRAIIPAEKVRDYLLAPANPRAQGKAAFFRALGFESSAWEALRAALSHIAETGTAAAGQQSEFGTKYEIRATISGPAGRQAVIRTVWIVNAGEQIPRFVTAYPD